MAGTGAGSCGAEARGRAITKQRTASGTLVFVHLWVFVLLQSFVPPTCSTQRRTMQMRNAERGCVVHGQFWPLLGFVREVKEEVNPCGPAVGPGQMPVRWIVRSEYEERPAEPEGDGGGQVACWGEGVVGVGDGLRFPCEGDGGCFRDERADVAEEVQAGSEGKAVGMAAEEADGIGAAVAEGGHFG